VGDARCRAAVAGFLGAGRGILGGRDERSGGGLEGVEIDEGFLDDPALPAPSQLLTWLFVNHSQIRPRNPEVRPCPRGPLAWTDATGTLAPLRGTCRRCVANTRRSPFAVADLQSLQPAPVGIV